MKVLFLDIDGVLTTPASIAKGGWNCFADGSVDRVNSILRDTGAVLVLSSDWRFMDDTDEILRAAGLAEQHPDKLLRSIEERREAAEEWLSRHDVEAWCAIDDNPHWRGHAPRFVKTWGKHGISRADARRAAEILGPKKDD